jgi:hypothetical protein
MKNKLTVVYVTDLNGIDDYILAEYNYRHQFGITNETVICFPTDVLSYRPMQKQITELLNNINNDKEKDYILFTPSFLLLEELEKMIHTQIVQCDQLVPKQHWLQRDKLFKDVKLCTHWGVSQLQWEIYE